MLRQDVHRDFRVDVQAKYEPADLSLGKYGFYVISSANSTARRAKFLKHILKLRRAEQKAFFEARSHRLDGHEVWIVVWTTVTPFSVSD